MNPSNVPVLLSVQLHHQADHGCRSKILNVVEHILPLQLVDFEGFQYRSLLSLWIGKGWSMSLLNHIPENSDSYRV